MICSPRHSIEKIDGMRICTVRCYCGDTDFCLEHDHGDNECDCPGEVEYEE